MSLPITITAEIPQHAAEIDALNALTFGPGRFARTAYRLREGSAPVDGLGHVALCGDRVMGSVQFTAVTIGAVTPALLLGPLCVHPDIANRGHGLALMRTGLDAARAAGHGLVILVGDLPYYARAGFVQVPAGQITLPGPVDPARLLALDLVPGALDGARGPVVAMRTL